MSQRIEYYEFLRGIAIIMVVGIHTFMAYPIDSAVSVGVAIVRQMLNCAVPIFLALSGLFCGRKLLDSKEVKISFLEETNSKSIYPCNHMVFTIFCSKYS